MKIKILILSFLFLSFNSIGQINVLLDIPGRLQWDNANGYCGEMSIQMSGLYYGNYICENITRTLAGGELLVAENDTTALRKLSFTYDEWDYNLSTPQYQNYLIWAKQHLNNHHPVIITVYIKGMSDPDYDHIIPAIGFNAANVNTYAATDNLMYNSCYDSLYFTRTFASIWDTRSMTGNGTTYEYCIPKNVDYGIAVTGIRDIQNVTRPVHLDIDSWDEPNVTLGDSPKMLHATITIDSLTSGQQYALLRYNNYLNVPSSNFNPLTADVAKYFTASGVTKMYTDSFMSNTAVFYRCIPYIYSGIQETTVNNTFDIYPNPSKNNFTVSVPPSAKQILILNSLGETIQKWNVEKQTEIAITLKDPGVYYLQLMCSNGKVIKKIIIY